MENLPLEKDHTVSFATGTLGVQSGAGASHGGAGFCGFILGVRVRVRDPEEGGAVYPTGLVVTEHCEGLGKAGSCYVLRVRGTAEGLENSRYHSGSHKSGLVGGTVEIPTDAKLHEMGRGQDSSVTQQWPRSLTTLILYG